MSRVLRVEVVILTPPAAILFVWRSDFQDFNAGSLQMTQQSGAIAASRFDTDTRKITKRAHPRHHLPIPLPCRGKAMGAEYLVTLIDHGSNMQIFVGIHTTDNTGGFL